MSSSSSILLRSSSSLFQKRGLSNVPSAWRSRPWLMLPPSVEKYKLFYMVGQEKVVRLKQSEQERGALVVGSSHGWVALFKERDLSLSLSNPITGEHMHLPPFPDKHQHSYVHKVILTCPPTHPDCRAAMTFDDRCLALCALGRSSVWTTPGPARIPYETPPIPYRSPSETTLPHTIPYEDFVYSRTHKLIVCLVDSNTLPSCRYDLEGWDFSNPLLPRIQWWERLDVFDHRYQNYPESYRCQAVNGWCRRRRYLVYVEHTDQLLLVTRHFMDQLGPDGSYVEDIENPIYPSKTMAFDVHLIDRARRKLPYLDGSLGGLALFVGRNQSFAVAAADFPGLRPDSIYFTDREPLYGHKYFDDKVYGGHDIGIFDYKNYTISSCYYPCHYPSFNKILPMPLWFTPTPHYY